MSDTYSKTSGFTISSLPSSLPSKENPLVFQSTKETIPDNYMSVDFPVINNSLNSVDSGVL